MTLLPKNNLPLIQRICLAGLFIALITICQKVIAINYIQVVPFVRLSFGGTALLIFASFLLGPWFGLFIGAASDLLGYFIFDPKTMGFFPQITLIYALLGLAGYFVFALVKLVKSKKLIQIIEYSVFAVFLLTVTLFISLNNEVTLYGQTYALNLTTKIVIPVCLFVLLALLVLINIFIDKQRKKYDGLVFNTYQISLACFILDIVVMVIFGTLMKGWAFGFQTYIVILISQIIVSFVNIPLNTFLISYIMVLTRRFIK